MDPRRPRLDVSGIGVCQGFVVRPGFSTTRTMPTHAAEEEFHAHTRDLYIPAGDIGMWQGVESPEGDVGEFALLQRADLVLPSEHGGPAYRCHFQRVSDCHRSRSAPSTTWSVTPAF